MASSISPRHVSLAILGAAIGVPLLLVLVNLTVLGGLRSCARARAPIAVEVGYVGSATCRECHAEAYEAWRGSHHDLAMQPAAEQTVLGDFDDAVFEHDGVTSRFFERDGGFFVETEGADGARAEFAAEYVFGVVPLQQYLLSLPGGRRQAFTVAWDTRPAEEGGQRWFHLYPDEHTPPGDELHWTAPAHNWNFACAECHSTDLRRGYDAGTDTYDTTWAEIDVACEACHGPGRRHVAVARDAERRGRQRYPADHGLLVSLRGGGDWIFDEGVATARLAAPTPGASELEACGRCHARRTPIAEEYVFGRPLSETHRVALLEDRLYFPDGQIRDEVYVYGSFKQSRMHFASVTCSDCHDPHSLKLRRPGNATCSHCHDPSVYDAPEHHFHAMDAAPRALGNGSECVECHMPERTYMVVDPRRDHSIRIPRPDLTVAMGVPNACNGCHDDRDAQWALDAVTEWYGEKRRPGHQRYAETLLAARQRAPGAEVDLAALAADAEAPAMARATATMELGAFAGPDARSALRESLAASDPLVRRAAVEALAGADAATRRALLAPRLADPVLGVRVEAARALSDVDPAEFTEASRGLLETALDEYVASEMVNADRAEHWVNLAAFHGRRGEVEEAEHAYAEALRRNPRFVPAWVNHADMYRGLDREADAERTLRRGLEILPDAAALHHSLGLLLVRERRWDEALASLAESYRLQPEDPRFGYVYGVALDSMGRRPQALDVWRTVVVAHPNEPSVREALAVALAGAGAYDEALAHAEHLARLLPDDRQAAVLVESIRRARGR